MGEIAEKIVDEQIVQFLSITDKDVFAVVDKDSGDSLFEISGYDLKTKFNFTVLKSSNDLHNMGEGIADLFIKMAQEALLEQQQNG